MPPKSSFEADLAQLDTLRDRPPTEAAPILIKTLTHRNNFLVAKAATLTLHHHLTHLTPNLTEAFTRFLNLGAKEDPQCWAKHALAKTLAAFELQDSDLFLRGLRHIQMEATWGGQVDTAGPLRGTCALALVQCRELSNHRTLTALLPLLADKDLPVRVNAVRAIEQVGTDAAALLLRLRAELGSDEPELLGSCYTAVLAIEGPSAIPWATRFLPPADDTAGEAALAIAATHTVEAFETLRTQHKQALRNPDPWFANTLLQAIALTRHPAATAWLLDHVASDTQHATEARAALLNAGPTTETLTRLNALNRP